MHSVFSGSFAPGAREAAGTFDPFRASLVETFARRYEPVQVSPRDLRHVFKAGAGNVKRVTFRAALATRPGAAGAGSPAAACERRNQPLMASNVVCETGGGSCRTTSGS